MLNTEDLHILTSIRRAGTVAAASQIVHLSQPAATRRVQSLERRLGVRLFRKEGRRLHLTEAGEEFVRRAEDILGRMGDLESEMQAFARGQRGILRIGATATVCGYLLPAVLERMKADHPQYELFLYNETSRRMPELVRAGAVDVGIASLGAPLEGLHVVPWTEIHLGALLPPDPAAARGEGPFSIRSLTGRPLVMSSPGSLRYAVDRALERYEVAPRIAAEADSLEVVRVLVRAGFGAAIVPIEVMREDAARAGLNLVPLVEEIDPVTVACFYRRIMPSLRVFLELLQFTPVARMVPEH